MSKKSMWTPPDPVGLKLTFKQKRRSVPDADYLIIKIFQPYRVGVAVNFERCQNLNDTHYSSEKYDRWVLSKLYLPVETEIVTLKEAYKSKNVTCDRLAVKIPNKFIFETDCPRLWPANVKNKLIKEILNNPTSIIKSIHVLKEEDSEKVSYVHTLTHKNWDFIKGQPDKNKSVEVDTKKVFEYAYF